MSSLVTQPAKYKASIHLLHKSASIGRQAEQTTLHLLSLCKSLSHLHQLHSRLIKLGQHTNPLVLTKFASASSSLDAVDYAFSFLFNPKSDYHLNYDAFLFNTVIRAFAQTQRSKLGAVDTYRLMLSLGFWPNEFTYPFVLKAVAGLGEVTLGQQVHGSAVKFGFYRDLHVGNTLVHMYGCYGRVKTARKVFDNMEQRNSVSWSAMIGGYVKMGRSSDAIELFKTMQVCGDQPDEVTMILVLSACTDLGEMELGQWVESYIEKHEVRRSVELCNALIDMLAKCGDVDRAYSVFRSMREKDNVSWTSMVVGLAMHGYEMEAISLFEEMKNTGTKPDGVTFIGLLTACSHAGLMEEGRRYFDSMVKDYGIIPRVEHYGCMVDLQCRVGQVKEALEFVQAMPIDPNPVILRTLASACHATGKLELSEGITKRLIADEPLRDSNYVILSNVYAKMASWDKKYGVRGEMEKRGMKKNPGSSR